MRGGALAAFGFKRARIIRVIYMQNQFDRLFIADEDLESSSRSMLRGGSKRRRNTLWLAAFNVGSFLFVYGLLLNNCLQFIAA